MTHVTLLNGKEQNGKIGRFKKYDILFVVGIIIMLWGALNLNPGIVIAGLTVTGLPIALRKDII